MYWMRIKIKLKSGSLLSSFRLSILCLQSKLVVITGLPSGGNLCHWPLSSTYFVIIAFIGVINIVVEFVGYWTDSQMNHVLDRGSPSASVSRIHPLLIAGGYKANKLHIFLDNIYATYIPAVGYHKWTAIHRLIFVS